MQYKIDNNLSLIRANWPKPTYMHAMDIWQILCYMGTFYCLTEYCVILYLTKTAAWEQELQQEFENKVRNSSQLSLGKKKKRIYWMKMASYIEKVSRVFVPVYYVLMPLIYFVISNSQRL